MSEPLLSTRVIDCGGCGRSVPWMLTVCPSCHGLIHRVQLESLSAQASRAEEAGEWSEAARLWRDVVPLLPQGTKQYDAVVARVNAATAQIGRAPEPKRTGWGRLIAPFAAVGAAAWKLKFLVSGLLKLGTLLSMLASIGVFWTAFGWPLAVALVVTTYIHELGHVYALKRLGFPIAGMMFVPGLGAYVRFQQQPATTAEEARISLAGPIWGGAAGVVAFAIGAAMSSKFPLAVTQLTIVINLLNLTPVPPLDGGRAFHAVSRLQRWLLVGIAAAAWAFTGQRWFVAVILPGVWRALQRDMPREHNWKAFAQFGGLLVAFGAILYFATVLYAVPQ